MRLVRTAAVGAAALNVASSPTVDATALTVSHPTATLGLAALTIASSPIIDVTARAISHPTATLGLAGLTMASLASPASALTCSSQKAHVVLLHGIFGWTTTEVGGIPHFQHAHILEETGCFIVHTPEQAILGSNFDRAVQVHAQLVGGFADHGLAHSGNASTEHLRYGIKDYAPMIPDFLERGGLPVYFVVHSLGASTYRQYEILLRDGSDAEKAVTAPGNLSSLYEGGHDGVVAGVVSLNGAIDGTALVDALGNSVIELAKHAVFAIEALTGDVSADLGFYDSDFAYLGARCPAGYTLDDCLEYVMALPAFNDPNWKDHAGVAGLAGAEQLNQQGDVTSSLAFYLSYVGVATRPSLLIQGAHVPQSSMSIFLKPLAYLIGLYRLLDPEFDAWRASDGVISVRGQECPRRGLLNNEDHCAMFTTVEDMQPGVWYRTYHTLDHVSIIGWSFSEAQRETGRNIWIDIGDIIQGMEAKHNRAFVSESTVNYVDWGVTAAWALGASAVLGAMCHLKKRRGRVIAVP